METNERILELVKEKGPVLPVTISKEINDSILMTSARLSELLSNKQIKISNIKVGGSPLYYFPGQESKLQEYSDNLVEREKEAFELLKTNKILRDSTQEPAIRVALRQIKDFAVSLQVNYDNKTEIFWRWYLADNKEAELLIKEILSKKDEIKHDRETKDTKEIREDILRKEIVSKTTESKEEIKKEKRETVKVLLLKESNDFLTKSKLNIINTNEVKKNSEIDFIVEVETTIGKVKYFCKSKNKKKVNEGDISSALVQAQSKNLPLLFLIRGELTKTAKEMLENEFSNIILKKI